MAAYFGALFHQTARTPVVLDTNEGIKQAVLAGMGISMLSEATCEVELHHSLLKRRLLQAHRSQGNGMRFALPTWNVTRQKLACSTF